MTIKVFKLELAQSLVTDSTGNAIDDPTGIRIDKISRRRLVFVVRLIDPSWFLEIQHQMSRSIGLGSAMVARVVS